MQLMIDIETLSTEPDAAISSIGAVAFDWVLGVQNEFYVNIDITDAIKNGSVCGNTLKWIFNHPEVIKEFISGQTTTKTAVNSFLEFIMQFNTFELWANSPSFDLVILKSAIKRIGSEPTWKYYHERDYRTLIYTANTLGFKSNYTPDKATHNALEDAHNQAIQLIDANRYLNELKSNSDERFLL